MRALIDIPEKQIEALSAICASKNLPRAEVVRQAIAAYIVNNKPETALAFGLWSKQAVDGLEYQEKVRAEW